MADQSQPAGESYSAKMARLRKEADAPQPGLLSDIVQGFKDMPAAIREAGGELLELVPALRHVNALASGMASMAQTFLSFGSLDHMSDEEVARLAPTAIPMPQPPPAAIPMPQPMAIPMPQSPAVDPDDAMLAGMLDEMIGRWGANDPAGQSWPSPDEPERQTPVAGSSPATVVLPPRPPAPVTAMHRPGPPLTQMPPMAQAVPAALPAPQPAFNTGGQQIPPQGQAIPVNPPIAPLPTPAPPPPPTPAPPGGTLTAPPAAPPANPPPGGLPPNPPLLGVPAPGQPGQPAGGRPPQSPPPPSPQAGGQQVAAGAAAAAAGPYGALVAGALELKKQLSQMFSAEGLIGGLGKVGSYMNQPLEQTGKAASAGTDAAVNMAGGGIFSAFADLGAKITPFVEALNPSAILVFQQAMRDMSAVIGVALQPVLGALTQTVRQASSILLPLAEQLGPMFGQLGQLVSTVAVSVIQAFASSMRALMPIVQVFSDVFAGLVPIFQAGQAVLSAMFSTIADLLKSLMGDRYKSGLDVFKDSMQRLAGAALIATGALAKLVGADSFLKNLILAAKGGERKSADGLAAATNAKTTDIRSFEREQLTAAFTATAGVKDEKTTDQWLKDAVEKLKDIESGNKDARTALIEEIKKFRLEVEKWLAALPGKLILGGTYNGEAGTVQRGRFGPGLRFTDQR